MQDNFVFFSSKYSDLDNMLPVLFTLLEADGEAQAAIYWYGKAIKEDSNRLLHYAQRVFAVRLSIWVPHNKGFAPYGEVVSAPNLMQRIGQRLRALWGFGGDQWLAACAADHLLRRANGRVSICFFGFSGKDFLTETAVRIKQCRPLWIRLPQGVRLSVSVFRTVKNVLASNTSAVYDYLPAWADEAIDVDHHIYTHYTEVYQRLGSTQQYSHPALLGAPRFSLRWIKRLDEAFADVATRFSSAPVQHPRVLFLLTPWQKNVWREEVLRVLEIVASYDVFLVVKGFHANTHQELAGKGYCVDEFSPTSALIRDADVTLFIATSAALDGCMRGKEMLQLSYLHGNQTSLEKHDVGLMAQCRDDIHLRMLRLVETGSILFDGEEEKKAEAEQFVRSAIVGNDPMFNYAEYIDSLIKKKIAK